MEVVLLLVGILGVALIVVPRMRARRSNGRKSAPARRRRSRARRAPAQAAAVSPVATWTPADAAASRSGDWEVWDDELGWEGVESAPAATPAADPEPEPAPAAEVAPPREPDRESWEQWRASELSDSGPEPADEPGGELPSVERWRERQADRSGDWDDDDGLGWESAAEQAEPVALRRDDAAPARDLSGPSRDFSGNGNGTPRVDLPRLQPAAHASVTAPEAEQVPPAAVTGREWLTDTPWEAHPAPATQTDGASGGNGNGHVIAPAAAPRRGRRRLSPVLLVAIYAAAGIGVVILVSTLLLGGSSQPKKSSQAAKAPRATATAQATPGSATDDAVPAATPDPAVAEAARKAKAAARAFRRQRTAAARREHGAVVGAHKAYRREQARQPARTAPVVQPPAYTPPPATSTTVSPPTYTPPARPAPPPNRCEFCIG
jgi:FtsZ-interacting cell division protein ZipA